MLDVEITVAAEEDIPGIQLAAAESWRAAYAGIFHKINGGLPEQREYLQAPLLEPMEADVCYEAGYWINLGDTGCGVNQTGVLFTQGPEPNPFEMTPSLDAGGPFYTAFLCIERATGIQ